MAMKVTDNYNGYTTTNSASYKGKTKQGSKTTAEAKSKNRHTATDNGSIILEISEQALEAQEASSTQKVPPMQETSLTQDTSTAQKDSLTQDASSTQKTSPVQNKQESLHFSNTKELMEYLKENYNIVRQGMASISGKFLRDCLTDEDKLQKLFENLAAADKMDADSRENLKGYQGMRVKIDENGEMETESSSGWVGFNEGKRARQLAAAKTQAHVQSVMALLQADLAECEAGKSRGMCDDETIHRVQAMIVKAQQRMGEVSGNSEEENPADEQAFLMAGLL